MNAELATYDRYLQDRIAAIPSALEGLSTEQLNRVPDLPQANSLFAIATHVLGSTRAWVLGIVCGRDLSRDRASEFVAEGTFEELADAASRLADDIAHALSSLDPALLDDRYTPPKELWGESDPYEIMRRDGLAHMLEHAGLHLGHIHLTRLWLEQQAE